MVVLVTLIAAGVMGTLTAIEYDNLLSELQLPDDEELYGKAKAIKNGLTAIAVSKNS